MIGRWTILRAMYCVAKVNTEASMLTSYFKCWFSELPRWQRQLAAVSNMLLLIVLNLTGGKLLHLAPLTLTFINRNTSQVEKTLM